jgi:AcrR family transcriptional regulator
MPAVVDHDSRRLHVARIAADIIARVGIDAVTMRQIATEAGFSTAIVTHYFASKQALLLHTYRMAADNAQTRVSAALQHDAGDLLGCIEALLPRDPDSRRDWKVFLAFWHTAVHDPLFAAEQAAQASNARRLLREVLQARMQAGLLDRGLDPEQVAQRLLVLIVGAALQAVFDPLAWSAAALRAFFVAELGELTGSAAPAS